MSTDEHHDEHGEPAPDETLRAGLRQRAEAVSPEVAQRLGAMRRAAVAELDQRESGRRRSTGSRVWIGGLAATAAAVVVTVALMLPHPGEPGPNALLLADADELAAVSDLDVLEDLEFLAWLEQEQFDAGQG